MQEDSTEVVSPNAASIGGTVVAIVIAVIVLGVVTTIAGFIATLFNYYMSSMRIEAAGFFGAILGGIAGTYAARASCDAILKVYHKRPVFVFFSVFIVVGLYVEFLVLPIGWRTITPVAQLITIGVVSWNLFWVGAEI